MLPGGDVGRGLAADIDPRHRGAEYWTDTPVGLLGPRGTRIGDAPSAVNFAVWWDADPLRELLDGNWIGKWERRPAAEFFVAGADFPPRAGPSSPQGRKKPHISAGPRSVRALLLLITSLRATL